MGGKKITTRTIKRKNAPTHPDSRRAAQLARAHHRTQKLAVQKRVRKEAVGSKTDRLFNLIVLLPPELTHIATLSALHAYVRDSYLSRHDEELSTLFSERRAGRPPSRREVELQTLVARERDEYRTGFELPDLRDETNVRLLRQWDGDPQALPMFRTVRISGTFPDQATIVQAGAHKELTERARREKEEGEAVLKKEAMAIDDAQ